MLIGVWHPRYTSTSTCTCTSIGKDASLEEEGGAGAERGLASVGEVERVVGKGRACGAGEDDGLAVVGHARIRRVVRVAGPSHHEAQELGERGVAVAQQAPQRTPRLQVREREAGRVQRRGPGRRRRRGRRTDHCSARHSRRAAAAAGAACALTSRCVGRGGQGCGGCSRCGRPRRRSTAPSTR